uniref:Zinc finger protein 280D n=1 Tax=Neogobius melanostomus TaxID=47308 RepID=A0A8C6UG07_9GOBI
MSELFMECVEEDLEPWQKSVPQINLTEEDDDDDEPIFVGVVCMYKTKDQKECITKCPPTQRKSEDKQDIRLPIYQPSTASPQRMLPLNSAVKPVIPTITPQPVMVNNQGFLVTPQITNNNVIASLGSHYPLGTSFTLVSVFQQITPTTLMQGVVHRPQVQNISNNIVTLSNVQTPTVFNTQPSQIQVNQTNTSLPVMRYPNSGNVAQNGMSIFDCPNCKSVFSDEDGLKSHASNCKPSDVESSQQQSVGSKHIMLVGEFYYGKYEGDGYTNETEKATTFKCQSCLKVLKNNIRFMNHMKHHLELEKQNSESFESHTTCQHCYRQYLTPFQLQCHIESAHSAVESTTNCKICELAFETEQVLLDHMKNNHKPGEMPYVCQVCNFRSSFFSDVEAHFRNAHENAKDILCPFCLKVFKSGHIYMQHYMRHQKKGIFRCGKCRLNFLSFKEKVEHRTQVHRTFIKPKALEGLAPGTKVTIRASITGNPSVTPSSTTPFAVSKFFVYVIAFSSTVNDVLIYLFSRTGGKQYKCIECKGLVNDFFTHFPMILNCGACKYQTNCKESIGNHMIRFHSTVSKSRFLKFENRRCFSSLKLTLVCLKCDLLLDASTGDRMAKHLTNRPNHRCKVIQEKGTPAETSTSTLVMMIVMPENKDETLSMKSLTAAADTNVDPSKPLQTSTSSGCEQENGSLDMATLKDSQESLRPDLSV